MTGANIMVVEDHPANRKLACDALELHGFNVISAANADEALKALSSFHPKVILMDIQLPDVDGLTLTQQIKKNPALADINIIAITAYAMKGDKEKILAAGCDDYISKPADIFEVIELIKKYANKTKD